MKEKLKKIDNVGGIIILFQQRAFSEIAGGYDVYSLIRRCTTSRPRLTHCARQSSFTVKIQNVKEDIKVHEKRNINKAGGSHDIFQHDRVRGG